ncbi:MAG: hypothetical protein J1E57_11275 [Prevotella sp.]|nr:hypothetical protein [Prevotella sp.]
MIVRLDKEQEKKTHRQLLNNVVYVISHGALKQMMNDGNTRLTPVEVFLSAQKFCETVLALPDIDEGIDDELDYLEEEAAGENDAMLIMTIGTLQMQALSKQHTGVDFGKIIQGIYGRCGDHKLFLPLMSQFAKKEEARWFEGKKTDLLNYELQEIRLEGGGSKEMKSFVENYVNMTLKLTETEIKSCIMVLSALNQEYGHLFDEYLAMLFDKLGIKPTDIHNHFNAGSGCNVFTGSVTGRFE